MYHYDAYDLGIVSFLPLPELRASAGAGSDVVIRHEKIAWIPRNGANGDPLKFENAGIESYFQWEGLGKFLVRGGSEIVVDAETGIEERLIRLPLLGTVLAVLLHNRGHLVLHASAVSFDGQAVVFLGDKGRGKSTIAAALYGRGHALIADDLVAVDTHGTPPQALPGFPHVKLYPEAAASSLKSNFSEFTEIAQGHHKLGWRLTERFAEQLQPVKAICVLARGATPALKPVAPQEAVAQLIKNTYVTRFGNQALAGLSAVRHLRQCVALVNNVPVYRLERPPALEVLTEIALLLESEISKGSNS